MARSNFRVVLRSEDRTLRCRAYLGDTPPTPSGGGGGHEVVEIPGRKPVLANDAGHRARQAFTVTLTEDNPEERIDAQHGSGAKRRASKRKRAKRGSAHPATHTVKAGETLSGIAAHYKVKGGWRKIAERQRPPIHDPRDLRVGRVLTLP
jgi:nucleoid-associated protein YgaU